MIEKAQASHIDKIMDIWLQTNIAAHSFIAQAYWEGMFAEVKTAMLLADVFVFLENDNVLGFIGITNQNYIAGLFVEEVAQGQGIGQKLLNHCKRLYPVLKLDVFTDNTRAVQFYKQGGFDIVSTETNPDFCCEEHCMHWEASRI